MSDMKGREEYSNYDTMRTEELQEILRKHAHDELETEPDTEELFYIMEVLAKRRESDPTQTHKTAEEAYADFVKYYAPEMAEDNANIRASKPGKVSARWFRRIAAVAAAAVLVVVIFAATGAEAFDFDLWGKIASWTDDFFHFADETQTTQGTEPEKEVNLELASLQEALAQYEITEKLAPTWLPDGYSFIDINVLQSPREISISAMYEKNGERIIISIRQSIGSKPEQVEKGETLVEAYDSDGVTYFIFSNYDRVQTVWIYDEFECIITGSITLDEMKTMIDSI